MTILVYARNMDRPNEALLEYLPAELLAALHEAARTDGYEPGEMLAEALAQYLGRRNQSGLPAVGAATPAYKAWLNAEIAKGIASTSGAELVDGDEFLQRIENELRAAAP